MDWRKKEDDKSDPKRFRTCARYGCRARFRRDRPWREKRGWGRYCGNQCRAKDQWRDRASRMRPKSDGQGSPDNHARGRADIDGGLEG